MTSYIQSAIKKLFGTPEYRLLILGLDAAGKTTVLYRLKLNEVVTTIPTIGFNVESLTYKKVSLTIWDIGGRDRMRSLMRHYFQNTQGLIFVVDACDRERLPEATDGLQLLFREDELRDAPLLIYLNKIDLERAMRPDEVIEKMRLHDIRNRSWHVQPCSATSGDGLHEGLDWLVRALKSPYTVPEPQLEATTTKTENTHRETNKSLQWLSQEDDDSNEQFIDKFRQHQLLPEQFDHRSLLRIIWTSLHCHMRKETIKTVFDHLPFYLTDVNETLTYFWIQIVHYAREATKNPTNDFAGFLLMNPQLLNEAEMPLVYYKKDTLLSKEAKASVVLPDVKALPSILPASASSGTMAQRAAQQSVEQLGDAEFLAQFESCSLSSWSHRTHVRMAWLYLRRDGRRAGVKKIFDGIKNFIASSSLGQKPVDHFTLTYFWIQMIDLAIAQSPAEIDFDEFLRLNPHLLKEDLYLQYYTKETMLNNPAAREEMVLPDIKPLPNLVASSNKK